MAAFCHNCFNINPENCMNCVNINTPSSSSPFVELLNKYNTKLNDYVTRIPNSHYILEVTKCCGYSEFIVIHKDTLLSDVYKTVSLEFQLQVNGLYVFDGNIKMLVPNYASITLRNFIVTNSNYFKPLYPVNAHVVYKMVYDDGHCHTDPTDGNMDIENCIVHS